MVPQRQRVEWDLPSSGKVRITKFPENKYLKKDCIKMNSKEYREFLETYNGIYEEVGVKMKPGESAGEALNRISGGKIPADKVIDSSKKTTLQKAHYEPEGEEYLDEAPLNYGDPVAAKWNQQLADFNVKGRGGEMTPPSIPKGYAYNAQAGTITKGGVAPIPATARTRPAAPSQQNLRGLSVGPGGFNINNKPVQTTTRNPITTTDAAIDRKYRVNNPPGDEFAGARKNYRPVTPTPTARPSATASTAKPAPRPATPAPTTRPATPTTTTTTTVTPKKPSITSDIKDLQKLRMASQMRQAGANVVSTQLASFDPFDSNDGQQLDELSLGQIGKTVERAADTYVKPNLERIGAQKGREKVGNLPILGDVAAQAGRRTAGSLYDQGKEAIKKGDVNTAIKTGRTALDMLRNSYEPDLFDYILEYLVAEGYADTNENALVIMANMSEDWRESIVESIARGSAPNSPTGTIGGSVGRVAGTLLQRGAELLKKNMSQSGGGYSTRPGDGKPYKDGPLWGPGSSDTPVKKPTPQRKPQGAPMRDEPLW
jgi:hypothetical protein